MEIFIQRLDGVLCQNFFVLYKQVTKNSIRQTLGRLVIWPERSGHNETDTKPAQHLEVWLCKRFLEVVTTHFEFTDNSQDGIVKL